MNHDNPDPSRRYTCECKKKLVWEVDDFHAIGCEKTRPIQASRHKRGVELLKAAIVKAWGSEAKFPQRREEGANGETGQLKLDNRVKNARGDKIEKYADIITEIRGNEFWIDVTFVNPGSRDSRSRGSLIRGGRAAEHREHTKKKHYAKCSGAANVEKHLVPFVIETTGRMGGAATKWIKKWIVAAPSLRIYKPRDPFKPSTVLYRALGTMCAKAGAQMVMRSREMMVRMGNAAALGGDEVAEGV